MLYLFRSDYIFLFHDLHCIVSAWILQSLHQFNFTKVSISQCSDDFKIFKLRLNVSRRSFNANGGVFDWLQDHLSGAWLLGQALLLMEFERDVFQGRWDKLWLIRLDVNVFGIIHSLNVRVYYFVKVHILKLRHIELRSVLPVLIFGLSMILFLLCAIIQDWLLLLCDIFDFRLFYSRNHFEPFPICFGLNLLLVHRALILLLLCVYHMSRCHLPLVHCLLIAVLLFRYWLYLFHGSSLTWLETYQTRSLFLNDDFCIFQLLLKTFIVLTDVFLLFFESLVQF